MDGLEVGFGRGIWPYEGPQFHPNADPRKDKENRELFQEMVEIVREIWSNEYFSYNGSQLQLPCRRHRLLAPQISVESRLAGRGEGNEAAGDARDPTRSPHPPLWMTVSTDRSVTTAAELGLKACYWQPPALRIRQRMELYAQVRTELEGRPFSVGEDQAVMRSHVRGLFRWRRRVEMRKRASCPHSSSTIHFAAGRSLQIRERSWTLTLNLDWDFLESRTLLVGSPENVVEKVQELREVCHLDYLLVEFSHMGIPLSKNPDEPGNLCRKGNAAIRWGQLKH